MQPSPIVASAPGKLVLLGEFAVVYGAPALVTAANVRATANITASTQWLLSLPNTQLHNVPLWGPAHHRSQSFVAQIVEAYASSLSLPREALPACHIVLQAEAFFDPIGKRKYGLGSSSAQTVALLMGLQQHYQPARRPSELLQLAYQVHRRLQQGLGSGIDIAASFCGGSLLFTPTDPPQLQPIPAIDRSFFAEHFLVVCSRQASNTAEALTQLADSRQTQPERVQTALMQLAQSVPMGLAGQWSEAFAQSYAAMLLLTEHCGLRSISPFHAQLHQWALQLGGAYKPSGAGGGDVGLVYCRDGEHRQTIASYLQQHRVQLLPVDGGAPGGLLESVADTAVSIPA